MLLHDHLDGGLRPGTIIELADAVGYAAPARPATRPSWPPGSSAPPTRARWSGTWRPSGTPSASCRRTEALVRVAAECAEDLAADGVVYAEVRFAPELHVEEGLEPRGRGRGRARGLPASARPRPRRTGRRIRVGCLLTAMRHAARSREIAELAVRYRDVGVVGFDIAGAEEGFPPTRHLDAFEYLRQQNAHFTIHAGEAFGLPSIWEALQWCGADRLGHGVRIVDDITLDARRQRPAGPARRLRARQAASRWRCARRRTSTRRRPVARRPPDRPARPAALPGHGQHRQPAHVGLLDDQRAARPRRRRSGTAGPTCAGSRSTR